MNLKERTMNHTRTVIPHKMKDRDNNRPFERITPEGVQAHYPYFYQPMIDEASGNMLIILKEAGIRNLHLLNLTNGAMKQVTFFDAKDDFADFGPRFLGEGGHVLLVVNNSICRLDLRDESLTTLYTPQEGWCTYAVPAITDDGRYIASVDFPREGYVNIDNSHWNAFDEQGKLGLRTQLFRLDLSTGHKEVLIDSADYERYGLKKNQWLGHPQFKPGDSDTIAYCHEGRGGTVDARIWLYDHRRRTIVCGRPRQYPGEIVSHEFFTGDGKQMGFVRIADAQSSEGSLRFLDSETLEETTIMDLPRCSHFLTNKDETFIIADADYPAAPYLHLIDIKAKRDYCLLKHHSSMKSYGNTQDAHPHPLFSPDDGHIFFVSDMEGYPAVYRCDVSDITKKEKYD